MRVDPITTSRSARRRAVVVADDDPTVRALLTDLLRLDGWRVSVAADGEELLVHVARAFAFDASGQAGIDLVVSDVWMPSCSGLDVLERLREAHRMTPVVLLSADPDPSLRSRVEALGGRLLGKPFTFDALRSAIREEVHRSGSDSHSVSD